MNSICTMPTQASTIYCVVKGIDISSDSTILVMLANVNTNPNLKVIIAVLLDAKNASTIMGFDLINSQINEATVAVNAFPKP